VYSDDINGAVWSNRVELPGSREYTQVFLVNDTPAASIFKTCSSTAS